MPRDDGMPHAVAQILPRFAPPICCCEPFAAAAALFLSRWPGKMEVLNGVNGELARPQPA